MTSYQHFLDGSVNLVQEFSVSSMLTSTTLSTTDYGVLQSTADQEGADGTLCTFAFGEFKRIMEDFKNNFSLALKAS